MQPVDDIITNRFIPTLFGCQISPLERRIFSMPVKNGGLGIPVLCEIAVREYSTSTLVTEALVTTMKHQAGDVLADESTRQKVLQGVLSERVKKYKEMQDNISKDCSEQTSRLLDQASEPCSSSWLSCLPLKSEGFVLNKSEFRDSVCLRYGKDLSGLPAKCPCGTTNDVTHAMNCATGGFIMARHNEFRDFEANLLKTVCNDVETEPQLQPVMEDETTSLSGDQAKPDIRARGFWRAGQQAFFDVKVINPNSVSYSKVSMKKLLERAENKKKRAYNDRIRNVEQGTFTPLIFSITGGMGVEAERYHKLLCSKIAYKSRQNYSDVIKFVRCKLSFVLKKLSLLCIRGSRKVNTRNVNINIDDDFEYNCFVAKL